MTPTIILISGANRGLGLGLLQRYLSLPDHIVIAANRDPSHPTSKSLSDLPKGPGSRLIVVKTDASVQSDAFDAVKELEAQGIDHFDIVIANAGVSYTFPKVSEVKIEDLLGHLTPNDFGVVSLYQATLPLLRKSAKGIFCPIGSTAGNQLPFPNATYGPSKAALHWLTKKMDFEEPALTSFVLSPGWVDTDLGSGGARLFGMERAPVGVEESCDGMVNVIAAATKESHGGKFLGYEGDILPW